MSAPDWWTPRRSSVDAEALDYFFWRRFDAGRADCPTYQLYFKYPVDKAGPVIEQVFIREENADSRRAIVHSLRELHLAKGYPLHDSVRRIIGMGTRDSDPEVQKESQIFLKALKEKEQAEQEP